MDRSWFNLGATGPGSSITGSIGAALSSLHATSDSSVTRHNGRKRELERMVHLESGGTGLAEPERLM
jgi:hypothetical protein